MATQVFDWIRHHADRAPDTIALTDIHSDRNWSYAELSQRIDQVAGSLQQSFGIERGDRVGVGEREAVAGVGVPGFFADLFSSADPDGVVRLRGGIEWAGSDTTYFVGALLPDRATSANARFQAIQPGTAAMAVMGFEAMHEGPVSNRFVGGVPIRGRSALLSVSANHCANQCFLIHFMKYFS